MVEGILIRQYGGHWQVAGTVEDLSFARIRMTLKR